MSGRGVGTDFGLVELVCILKSDVVLGSEVDIGTLQSNFLFRYLKHGPETEAAALPVCCSHMREKSRQFFKDKCSYRGA